MSLDLYFTQRGAGIVREHSGIYIRECGETKEISASEWNRRFPDQPAVVATVPETEPEDEVFSRNITHNLNRMADEAGIYDCLWRPDEHGITKAGQMIEPLAAGIDKLKAEPERFKAFNPKNGWGNYDLLLEFAEAALEAARKHPDADVRASR
jgi:hypothetical protein